MLQGGDREEAGGVQDCLPDRYPKPVCHEAALLRGLWEQSHCEWGSGDWGWAGGGSFLPLSHLAVPPRQDVYAYRHVGLPESRIFMVNPKGELVQGLVQNHKST